MLKRLLTWLLIIVIALPFSSIVPVYASESEPVEIDLATINEDTSGSGYNYSSGLLTITGGGPFTITTSSSVSGRGIVVDTNGAIASITLDDVSISNTASNACAVALADGAKAHLTLSGTNTLVSGQYRAGLEVPAGAEITITGTATDKLTVTGGRWSAGLGGSYGQNGGVITITGTEIIAMGDAYAAGIGSGRMSGTSGSSGGTITITGAKVTATGGASGAGIGGGYMAAGGIITITNSVIDAAAGNEGAGIGGGRNGSSGTISITDSVVEATGGAGGGAGIGGGDSGHAYSISISGTSTIINAQGGSFGAGIGGGDGRNGGSITISGGTITATGGVWGAGIGGGRAGNGGSIQITGGEVTATGTEGGAGIGGGRYNGEGGIGGTVVISEATVAATSTSGAKDIGAGLGSTNNGWLRVGLNSAAVYDSLATRAYLTLNAGGADQVSTTIGTCTIAGAGAGDMAGTYIEGVKITLIDLATVSGSGEGYSFASNLLTITDEGPYVITSSTLTSNRVLINTPESVTAQVIIHDLDIISTAASNSAFALSGSAKAELTLSGNSSFASGSNRAGLEVPSGTELTILGTSTDSLHVTGGQYAAGIGGGYSVTPAVSGTIIIKGGVIEAVGGLGRSSGAGLGAGAGIGGGRGGSGGNITIEGGDITATGSYRAAGIGGGTSGTSGTIVIKGGDVTAVGHGYSAGIGGGAFRPANSITIEGGTIDATGVGGGSGIGNGYINTDLSATYNGGTITISGGDITARAESQGSGIGSGLISSVLFSLPTRVTITGGVINATSQSGAGIGSRAGTITISGGTVTATSSSYGAGIGGGYGESGGTITITGGTVISSGGVSNGGAGIGGGHPTASYAIADSTIFISGGDITAIGGEYAAGIGGGYDSDAGMINITGGDITANGTNGGAGIGGGYLGGAGTITITGSTIAATGSESGAAIGRGHGNSGSGAIVISQAQISASNHFGHDAISAGTGGTIDIGFTGVPPTPAYDPIDTRAEVTFTNGGISEDGLTFGTCLIIGDDVGELAGSYIEGVKQVAATYTIAPIDNQIFTALDEGYSSSERQTLTLTIENTGTGSLTNLAVALSGDDAGSFTVSQPAVTTLSSQGNTTSFTVTPQTGLFGGTYLATVTISANELTDVTFTVAQDVMYLFGGGDGSSAAEAYEISTPEQLGQLAYNVHSGIPYDGMHFKLTNNLDLSTIPDWTPIGNSTHPFKGHFDGNNHVLSNLTIGTPSAYNTDLQYVGLFGYIDSEATIQNIGVTGVQIYSSKSGSSTGGLVGQNSGGSINHCYATGDIVASGLTGGLVGNNTGDITNSYASVDIITDRTSSGGLVGQNIDGSIINCFATGNVNAGAYPHAGGLVGYTNGGNIQNCYATGNVSGSAWGYIGGLYGRNYIGATSCTDNYWNEDAEIIATEYHGYTPFIHGSTAGCLAKPSAELKNENFVALLNSGRPDPLRYYGWDLVLGSNSGYPIFKLALDDITAPTIANGTISANNITQSSVELSWPRAVDDVSSQSALQYRVYRSNVNNLGTVNDVETNGTPVGNAEADIAIKTVTNLSSNNTFFFNVLVVDEAGNKSIYNTVKITTLAVQDTPYRVEHYQQNAQRSGYTLKETELFGGMTGEYVTAAANSYSGLILNEAVGEAVTSGTITADGSLVLKLYYDRVAVAVIYETRDPQTGIELSGLNDKIRFNDLNDPETYKVIVTLIVKDALDDVKHQGTREKAKKLLGQKGYLLLNTYDISLMKKALKYDGTFIESIVPNSDITGMITVRIPVPDELKNKKNLAVAYIDDAGNVEVLVTKIVQINGKNYLEFETDHLSLYAIVESAGELPKTGGMMQNMYYLLGMMLPLAGVLLKKKYRKWLIPFH